MTKNKTKKPSERIQELAQKIYGAGIDPLSNRTIPTSTDIMLATIQLAIIQYLDEKEGV